MENKSPDAYGNFGQVVNTVFSDEGTTTLASTTEDNSYTLCATHYGCRLTRQKTTSARASESNVVQKVNYGYDSIGLLKSKEVNKTGDVGTSVNDVSGHGPVATLTPVQRNISTIPVDVMLKPKPNI